MTTNNEGTTTPAAPADVPQPATKLAPEAIVELLRTVRAQIGDLAPMTAAQRKALRNRARTKSPVLQASINAMGASDKVSEAVGQPADEVRQKHAEANRWTAVEDELRSLLSGVVGANLIRRQEVALLAAQAANLSTQLARTPANAVLIPHVQEIRRLKSFQNRKKAAPAPGSPLSPASEHPAAQESGTSGSRQE
jgi:sulfite reductase beta subunit-like hemoprotein